MMICLTLLGLAKALAAKDYPVPVPRGGRTDVHGWLVLPLDQPTSTNNSQPNSIQAWFSHHVPEFWHDSPHNFQIILQGELKPTSSVDGELYPLVIPHPPNDNLLTYEYSFTPPSPFSLNNLLTGLITNLHGMYHNGSFDTPYERIPQSLATLTIIDLTTAVYLDEYETDGFEYLQYLSYPRSLISQGSIPSNHFYFAHEIHAQPDFDHVAHGIFTSCSDNTPETLRLINIPGSSWKFDGITNVLDNKLMSGQKLKATYNTKNTDSKNTVITCEVEVLESLHCMIGPGFMDNC